MTRANKAHPTRLLLAGILGLTLVFGAGGSPLASGATGNLGHERSPALTAQAAIDVLAGANRYETAVSVSRQAFPEGSASAVLVNGNGWADAVGGAALAGATGGPVLLVRDIGIPDATLEEIERLAPKTVFVLGGEQAVGDVALEQLSSAGIDPEAIVRLSGADRWETAALVASETISSYREPWYGRAFVASGRSYADALAAGPVAIRTQRPIYLIDDAHVADVVAAMKDAGVRRVTVLGGDSAVSPAVRTRIAEALGGVDTVDRIAGATRYETANLIADFSVRYYGFSLAHPGLATGAGFADALAAGPLLASQDSPLLLAPPGALPESSGEWLYARRAGVARLTVFGGESAVSARSRQEVLQALVAPPFSEDRAMRHVASIAAFGPRPAGGAAEREACEYVAARLREYGYAVGTQDVWTPHGISRNVIAERKGTSNEVIVLGGHVDSKPPSPGANDNASGVAVALELARVLAEAPVLPTVRFIAFGAEEISGATADDHHFGSRQYVAAISSAEKARIAGMVSIDMVGYGDTFNIRSLGLGSKSVVYALQGRAGFIGQPLGYLRDPGRYGWSDHEGFERAGIPAAWLEWREDPVYHTSRDVVGHVRPELLGATGGLLRGWLLALSPQQLDALR